MARVVATWDDYFAALVPAAVKFVAPEGLTLARAARTDDPPAVPMSGGQEPAGAAKHPERGHRG